MGVSSVSLAVLAKIRPRRAGDRMQVATLGAPLELAEDWSILTKRQNSFIDEVARPFVVDYGPRTEFGDSKEPRSRKELVSLLGAPAWGVRDRKSTRLNSSHLGISYAA